MATNHAQLTSLSKKQLINLLQQQSGSDQAVDHVSFEKYTSEIISISPDALLILDPKDMRLLNCNKAALKLLQLQERKQLEKYLDKLFEQRPLFYDLLLELSSTLSEEPQMSMEVEFDTSEHQQRFGDLVVRKIEVLGRSLLMLRIVDITEVKQTQIQVLDSERQLEMAQEIAQIGSYIYYQQEKRFQFSKTFFQILDLEKEDPKPETFKDLTEFVLEDDRPLLQESIQRVYQNREDISLEFRVLSKMGDLKYFFCKVKVEEGPYGHISKVVGTVQDITDRILTEQRLRESEERYRLTIENTNDGVWYYNFKTLEGFMSPKFDKYLGFEDRKITTDSVDRWFEKVHPDDRQKYRRMYDDCVSGLIDSYRMEFRYKVSDGQYTWVESGAALMRDNKENPSHLMGTIRKIHTRKLAEIKLKEQERFLSMAQRVAHIGSWIWYTDQNFLQLSDELYHILQIDNSVVQPELSQMILGMVEDEEAGNVDRFIYEMTSLPDDLQYTTDAKMRMPEGEIKVFRITAQAYKRNLEGDITEMIGTVQDISDYKRREQELREAKEQAEVSQRAKDRFLQIVSHEIRNPLNAIIGITNLLEQSELWQSQKEQLATLSFSSRHLLSIINDILDTAKLQYGNIKLDQLPFSLQEQLTQIEETFKPLAANQETDMQLTLDDKLPPLVLGDPTRFNQIIFNLLSNSVKYTYRGLISLKADMLSTEGKLSYVQFKISDTGSGIPANKLDKVFEAFEQFDLPQSEQKGGTGLGLYIVRELVGIMNGKIDVRSDFGEGTTFLLTLPFEQAQQEIDHEDALQKPQADLSKKKVLYVEDAHYNQLLLKGYAQVWNLQLDLASSVEEAIKKVTSNRYDLILTDYRLPDGTGSDLALRSPDIHKEAKIPLVVISAYQMEGVSELYLFDDYIQKPINFDKFFYILKKYLNKKAIAHKEKKYFNASSQKNALHYLEETQPEYFEKIVDEILVELPDYQRKIIQSIDDGNYRLYLSTVHKLSSALKMVQGDDLLNYLQDMEDLPTNTQAKNEARKKIKNLFLEIENTCLDLKEISKKTQ